MDLNFWDRIDWLSYSRQGLITSTFWIGDLRELIWGLLTITPRLPRQNFGQAFTYAKVPGESTHEQSTSRAKPVTHRSSDGNFW